MLHNRNINFLMIRITKGKSLLKTKQGKQVQLRDKQKYLGFHNCSPEILVRCMICRTILVYNYQNKLDNVGN